MMREFILLKNDETARHVLPLLKNIYIIMLDNNNNFIIAYNYISMAFLYIQFVH